MKLSREDILRMVGLTSRGLGSRLNEIEEGIEGAGDTLERYWTQIVKNEREITLIAGREAENETNIAQLQVTAREISARVTTVSNEVDEVSGVVTQHTTKIGELTVSDSQIRASVQTVSDTVSTQGQTIDGLSSTVSTHTTKIGQLEVSDSQIRSSVSTLTTTVNSNTTKIGQLEVSDSQIRASVQTVSDDLDTVSGTVSTHTTKIGQLEVSDTQIRSSVSSLTTTVNGHTQSIGQLEITANQVSQRVTVIEGDYVKNAQISLMVTKNAQGYISNALIDADDIDFVFTDAVSWYWQSQTEANKRMGLDSNGDLWISGQYRGGTITDNVNVGTTGNKMQIYTDETISPQTGYKKSGIRGVNGNTTLLDLGFGDNNYPMMTLRAPTWTGSPQVTHYPGFSRYYYGLYYAEFGMVSSGDGRIHIYAPLQAWPNRDQVTIGAVFVGNDEILRVRLS